jgi:hypothetical protein
MKILLTDFNTKVVWEDIFKPTTGNENLHEISNDNGVIVVNFATSEKLLRDRRPHSSIFDARSFRAAESGTDRYFLVINLGRNGQ